ncbi:unnamed protein product, partial [Vitrella brassicaformis CCMP3155]
MKRGVCSARRNTEVVALRHQIQELQKDNRDKSTQIAGLVASAGRMRAENSSDVLNLRSLLKESQRHNDASLRSMRMAENKRESLKRILEEEIAASRLKVCSLETELAKVVAERDDALCHIQRLNETVRALQTAYDELCGRFRAMKEDRSALYEELKCPSRPSTSSVSNVSRSLRHATQSVPKPTSLLQRIRGHHTNPASPTPPTPTSCKPVIRSGRGALDDMPTVDTEAPHEEETDDLEGDNATNAIKSSYESPSAKTPGCFAISSLKARVQLSGRSCRSKQERAYTHHQQRDRQERRSGPENVIKSTEGRPQNAPSSLAADARSLAASKTFQQTDTALQQRLTATFLASQGTTLPSLAALVADPMPKKAEQKPPSSRRLPPGVGRIDDTPSPEVQPSAKAPGDAWPGTANETGV